MRATIFDIQHASAVDGPGLRTAVFFKGCNLHCAWCHNPESQSFARQLLYYKDRCTQCGTCKDVCPNGMNSCTLCGTCARYCKQEARSICGKEYMPDEIMKIIAADRIFYEVSGGGVTFSGGEFMLQLDFLEEILRNCKTEGIHTAVDTAGHVPFDSFERILPYTDMLLYDVKSMDCETHRRYTGVGNELILSNLAQLLRRHCRVWIRVPIVPGVNDTLEEMHRLRAFLMENGYPEKVELLPYHRMGEAKYRALGKESPVFGVPDEMLICKLEREVAV